MNNKSEANNRHVDNNYFNDLEWDINQDLRRMEDEQEIKSIITPNEIIKLTLFEDISLTCAPDLIRINSTISLMNLDEKTNSNCNIIYNDETLLMNRQKIQLTPVESELSTLSSHRSAYLIQKPEKT